MVPQNYNAEEAYARWRSTGLRRHLQEMRASHRLARFLAPVTRDLHPDDRGVAPWGQWFTTKFGLLTWGVFTRAFWAIYQKGTSPLFFGSVIVSGARDDEDAPSLFEVAEQVRVIRDCDVPTDGIEDFADVIRDDYSMPMRVAVPESVAMQGGYFLQSIGIPRRKLPHGYLHHRLVPIVTHPRIPYATILDCRFWNEDFKRIWRSGNPLLTEDNLRRYREEFPEVDP